MFIGIIIVFVDGYSVVYTIFHASCVVFVNDKGNTGYAFR